MTLKWKNCQERMKIDFVIVYLVSRCKSGLKSA